MSNGQQVKHRIGRTTHGNIKRHGIQEGFTSSYAFRQYTFITFFIIFICILYDKSCRILEELCTIGMSSQNRTIAWQSQAQCLIQTIHRIGRKHTRTASATRTSMVFNLCHIFVTYACIGTLNHCINQIEVLTIPFTCFHRTSRNKHSRNVQTHSCHQHTRRNLVAIGDTYHCIRFVSIYHILHRIGNDITTWQRIKHTVMPHGNTIVHSNGIELSSKTTELFYFRLYLLTYFMQMRMSRHKLGE